jgi:hypothetical protein
MTTYSKERFLRLISEQRINKTIKEQNIVDDAIDDPENVEHADSIQCSMCGGDAQLMGYLGNRKQYKCQSCGLDISKELDENRWGTVEEEVVESVDSDDEPETLEECGCEDTHEEEACPICGTPLMNGACEQHGHVMHSPMELETVFKVESLQRLAGLIEQALTEEEVNEVSVASNLPTTPGGFEEEDSIEECDMAASNAMGDTFEDWE